MHTEYDHEGSMTLINDGSGYIYSALTNFLMSEAFSKNANSGFVMTIKALTGDKDYKGMLVTLRGVRISSINGLGYDYSS